MLSGNLAASAIPLECDASSAADSVVTWCTEDSDGVRAPEAGGVDNRVIFVGGPFPEKQENALITGSDNIKKEYFTLRRH